MLFNTPQYLLFLPIVILVYYCIPKRIRYIWLLVVSYYFYMKWSPLYIILLFSCTLVTYLCGRIIQGLRNRIIKSSAVICLCGTNQMGARYLIACRHFVLYITDARIFDRCLPWGYLCGEKFL